MYDKIDIQSAFIASHMFRRPVEDFFCEKGWKQTADFVMTVCQWHSVCNMQGISVDMRV